MKFPAKLLATTISASFSRHQPELGRPADIWQGQPLTFDKSDLPKKQFIYGTAFYRPPNPPHEQRREMLQTIAKDYGFNIIRIYPGWDYYNPAPDRFVFDDLEEVMQWCDEFGIKVLMGLVT